MAYRAFLDANVLVPARVRDVLLTLGEAGAYTPLWSPDVLDESRRHLPAGIDGATADHLFRQMARAFPEASVAWPGEVDISIAELVNPHDHHVVCACLWAHADVLVTDDGPLTKEVTALVDCQSAGIFVTYAVDSIGDQAVEALLAMARLGAGGVGRGRAAREAAPMDAQPELGQRGQRARAPAERQAAVTHPGVRTLTPTSAPARVRSGTGFVRRGSASRSSQRASSGSSDRTCSTQFVYPRRHRRLQGRSGGGVTHR